MRDRTSDEDTRQAMLSELLKLKRAKVASPALALVLPIIDELEKKPAGEIDYPKILKRFEDILKRYASRDAIAKNEEILNAKSMVENHLRMRQDGVDLYGVVQVQKGKKEGETVLVQHQSIDEDKPEDYVQSEYVRDESDHESDANKKDNVDLYGVVNIQRGEKEGEIVLVQYQGKPKPEDKVGGSLKQKDTLSTQESHQQARPPSPQREQPARPRSPNLFDRIGKEVDKLRKNLIASSPASNPDDEPRSNSPGKPKSK